MMSWCQSGRGVCVWGGGGEGERLEGVCGGSVNVVLTLDTGSLDISFTESHHRLGSYAPGVW